MSKAGKKKLRPKKTCSTERIKKRRVPSRLAVIDHLTGLYNRRYFDKSLKKIISESKRKGKQFSILMIDIDNFKTINDKYGHVAGDEILKNFAKVLKQSVRRFDTCFRYGGDEIAIILPNADKEVTQNVISRLKPKVETQKFSIGGEKQLYLILSIGFSIFPKDGTNSTALIKKADSLLYEDKRKKRKHIEPFVLMPKLTLPTLKENIVTRSRLISLFSENFNKKLIILVADAGYGKTTLLTQLTCDKNLPFVFYDLDKSDNDPMVFLSYLAEGLEKVQPNLSQRTIGLLGQGADIAKNYELVIGTMINELIEKYEHDLFFILDDYHNLPDGSLVHKALDYFIDNLPDTVHVIISSRVTPPLFSLAKWRAKQDLFEIFRGDLKFTQDEVKVLLNEIYKVILPTEELKIISEHTEGWITGIQLILQTAGKDRKTVRDTLNGYLSANQPLFEYFANEIMTGENSEVQIFLRYSSILEIITPDACDKIFNTKSSAQLLKDLERRNLFLSVVGDEEYKYHPIFRQFLQEQIKSVNLSKPLNFKAARYYESRKQVEKAIAHYLKAGSLKEAASLITNISRQMEDQARFTTLNTWFKQLPEDIIRKRPTLLVTQGNIYRMHGELRKAEESYVQAENLLSSKSNRPALTNVLLQQGTLLWIAGSYTEALKKLCKALRICPNSAQTLMLEILNLMGMVWINIGNFKNARVYLNRAYRKAERIKDTRQLILIGVNAIFPLLQQGEVKLAFKSLMPLIERINGNYTLRIGIVFANAARAAIDLGKVEWAEQILDKGWELCRHYEDPWSQSILQLGFGSLHMRRGQWKLAEKYLVNALNGITNLKWTRTEFVALRELSRLYRYWGDYNKTDQYLEQMRQRFDDIKSPLGIAFLTEVSLLQISLGNFDKAEKTIKTTINLSKKFGLKVGEFLSYLALAASRFGRGKNREALRCLKSAFRLSKDKGYDGILICELRHMPHLVDLAEKYDVERNYLLSLNLPKYKLKLQLKIQCFGGLQIQDKNGKPFSLVWPTEKTRSLFAFLIEHRQTPVHGEIIMTQLWPELTKNRASENFRTTASRLRQTLFKAVSGKLSQDDIFIWKHGRYQLFPQVNMQVDTGEFNLLLKEAERTQKVKEKIKFIQKALNFYKGDYLPEVYDSWTDVFRRSFRERRLNALRWLIQYVVRKRDDLDCVEACEAYLLTDPLSEEVVRLYMKSLARLGRIKEVKVRYKTLKQLLQKELQGIPSKETEELYHSILKSHSKS